MQKSPLFHHKTIKKWCEPVKPTPKQIEASRKWLGYMDAGDLEDERGGYLIFTETILRDILGFPVDNIAHEVDNVEFSYPKKGDKELCIECKGTRTADLYALQHRTKKEHETPIKQTWDYMSMSGMSYGICTNYKDFVLITKDGYPKTHLFDFQSIKENPEKLKDFIGIFSKERLIDNGGFVEQLRKESVEEEKEITTEFYKLFHQTRLMMIRAFQEKEGVTKDEAITYAQLYLNRLIFIFFAEDNNFLGKKLFMERVKKSLNSNIFESSKSVSDQILDLFRIMDEGSDRLGIVGFGGGLFQERIPSKIHFLDLRDKKSFNDITSRNKLKINPNNTIQSIIDRERKLNPIIKNLLMMDSFDFTTELNVNILGHIFEQSISDLEELKEEKVSRRKKEGVFYTPEYITDYICRNTIIPYLSKSGANSIRELIIEYEDNIEELEKKFREIKILDPACGSGAFLVKAVDILLEIHKEILGLKIFRRPEKYSDNGQTKMDKWNEESEAKKIIENNIYGVDVNPESVAVTKLALFLKIAERGKKLTGTTNNIKVGNSLISDKSIDEMAFDWEEQFPEKFDVIIGNPPYLNIELLGENARQYFHQTYQRVYMRRFDAYGLFIEKSISLLTDGGLSGVIVPSTMLNNITFTKLRKLILDSTTILQIVNLGGKIFKNAINDTMILIFTTTTTSAFDTDIHDVSKYGSDIETAEKINTIDFLKTAKPPRYSFELKVTTDIAKIFEKMESISVPLSEICFTFQGFVTGKNEAYIVTDNEIDAGNIERVICKPSIFGKEVKRYGHSKSQRSVIYLTPNEKISDFPQIKKRLMPFKTTLGNKREVKLGRQPWYSLHWPRKRTNFESKEKLLVLGIRNLSLKRRIVATIDYDGLYVDHSLMVNILENPDYDLRYVLGILNSKIINFYFQKKYIDIHILGSYLDAIPIPKITIEQQKPIIEKVNQILSIAKKKEVLTNTHEMNKIDAQLDELIYKLYGITEKERKVIEEENP